MLALVPTLLLAASPEALGQYRGDPKLPPIEAVPQGLGAPPSSTNDTRDHGVVFVNFDGAELTSAPEDARADQTQR